MTQTPEGEYRFYKEDREHIKGRSMLPTETLRYIEALEAVARAAHKFWSLTEIQPGNKEHSRSEHTLYDALFVVNFMDEDL